MSWVLQDPLALNGSQPLHAILLKRCKDAAAWQGAASYDSCDQVGQWT